jgi:hypothetical protein
MPPPCGRAINNGPLCSMPKEVKSNLFHQAPNGHGTMDQDMLGMNYGDFMVWLVVLNSRLCGWPLTGFKSSF